jgi:hypothetical protein
MKWSGRDTVSLTSFVQSTISRVVVQTAFIDPAGGRGRSRSESEEEGEGEEPRE